MRAILGALIARVDVFPEKVNIHLVPLRIVDILWGGLADLSTMPEPIEASERSTLSVPARFKLMRESRLPLDWREQRDVLGFA